MGWQITFSGIRRVISDEEREAEIKAEGFSSIWSGGKVVDFDDLSPDFFGKIAEKDLTASWWGVYLSPTSDDKRLYRVLSAAAEHAGVEVPRPASTMREAKELLAMFEQIPDPTEGLSESTTVSSTGPLDDSDGPLPSPDEN